MKVIINLHEFVKKSRIPSNLQLASPNNILYNYTIVFQNKEIKPGVVAHACSLALRRFEVPIS
jgi:hypothetical protein